MFSAYLTLSVYFIISEVIVLAFRKGFFDQGVIKGLKQALGLIGKYGVECLIIGTIAIIWEIVELGILPKKKVENAKS